MQIYSLSTSGAFSAICCLCHKQAHSELGPGTELNENKVIFFFFSAGIRSSRSCSAALLDDFTNISVLAREWDMLAWDQVAEVGMRMDNSKFNILGKLSEDFIIIET